MSGYHCYHYQVSPFWSSIVLKTNKALFQLFPTLFTQMIFLSKLSSGHSSVSLFNGLSIVYLWSAHGLFMVCLWSLHGLSMVCVLSLHGLLRVPFACTSARQKRAFAVVGPSIWNGLPLSIRSLPRILSQTFLSQLKAVLFGRVGVGSASE